MAVTQAGAELTAKHRAAQLAIRARSLRGLIDLWPIVQPEDLSGTIDTFIQAAVLLAGQGYDSSATEAIAYFRSFRRTEAPTAGVLPGLVAATRPAAELVAADLRGATLKGIIDARRAGLSVPDASRRGLIRVAGALTKQVLAGGRMTIITGAQSDPVALGWGRVTSGDPCTFCRMLASRGATYKTQESADFQPHDACACVPEPLYMGRQRPGSPLLQAVTYQREYQTAQEWARESGTMSKGTANDAVNNYRRWLANGSPEPGRESDGSNPE
jgi:hypothetical protein